MVTSRAYLENGRLGQGLDDVRAEVGRLMSGFIANGAQPVEPAALLPADVLIDLYGEDLRARAYTTHDPVEGELMLRPDFTVPVVQIHMANGASAARYAYAGSVWRRQEVGSNRPTEYLQAGFEVFGGTDPAADDAEVFAVLATALGDLPVMPVTGDLGLIFAAIEALDTNERRKSALRRHVWRPQRFKRLLERYSAKAEVSAERARLLQAVEDGSVHTLIKASGAALGVRSIDEIAARAEILLYEKEAAALSETAVALVSSVLELKSTMGSAAQELRRVAPMLGAAADGLEARAQALSDAGIDVSALPFEASYGRTTLEYYDGFVFGFHAPDRPDLPQIAQGGRYDALTRVLGDGKSVPAVGGIIRPEAALALNGGAV
ncbi:ATP phosphoribosyltransferase regulatory subunit [Rhodobacterales bacterium 52_120_T64]|nr:ATP phosphoribosyltransferase regulatory subunit [Rhodobacterales bacterium 52_120_T64]